MFVFPFDLLSLDELSLLLFLRKIMIFLLFNPFYVKEVKAKFLINLFFNDKLSDIIILMFSRMVWCSYEKTKITKSLSCKPSRS